ncbi:recombinase family protein [Parasphingorhabdus sp.]|uniref:recombinase family protein n=1 Tax=Parasphingorhabdus sp. TaxID=2709688 RepID=UPI003A928517
MVWSSLLWFEQGGDGVMNPVPNPVRCAIYTRKSTEDGLEQEFNSLDAQREACEAYILSQRHEGWKLVAGAYDDGGYSGGTMERPGLKALMLAVEDGLVDVIVVYKVDRLTRSLADFAKIVEILDERKASFVSITQAFNTTTSMGRLTLNVLLSFAQFEREVTGERIRDKIAASKKKGMWMGGPVPLGYIVENRKLVAEPEEAERVRTIMRHYLASKSAPALLAQLESEGILTKVQQRVSGPHRGGIPFRRGSLFHLLKNPVYRGKIVHKGQIYDGEHQAIVDAELWEAVQAKLASAAPPRKRPGNDPQQALLKGLLSDSQGRPMVATYATKGVRRYRYYETRRDLTGPEKAESTRYAMVQLERHVAEHIGALLGDQHALRRIAGLTDGGSLQRMFAQAQLHGQEMATDLGSAVQKLVRKISFAIDRMIIELDPGQFGIDEPSTCSWAHEIPLPRKKPFREAKLRINSNDDGRTNIDPKLLGLLADAMSAQKLVLASPDVPLQKIAKREGCCRKQLTQFVKISWISPRIVEAIVEGRQPSMLSRKRLMETDLSLAWGDQERLLGIGLLTK